MGRQLGQQLRAAGARVAPPTTSSWDELTAQQQRIVRMAAAGLGNREIADHLHLSVRTVSSHLYRSFPKLGIASRSQLASVVIPETE